MRQIWLKLITLLCTSGLSLTAVTPSVARADHSAEAFTEFLTEYESLPESKPTLFGKSWLFPMVKTSLSIAPKKKAMASFQNSFGFKKQMVEVDFFGIPISVHYAAKILSNEAPLVVYHPGFIGKLESGTVGRLMETASVDFPNSNILIVEGLSNSEFSYRNCFFALGGLHEPFILRDTIKKFTEITNLKNKNTVIFGGSSSSFSVLMTPTLLNREDSSHPIKGSFLISGYNNLESVYRWMIRDGKKDSSIADPFFLRLGIRSIMKKRSLKMNPSDSACVNELSQLGDQSFPGILEWTRVKYKKQFELAWKALSGTDSVPEWKSYSEFLSSTALDKWITHVSKPFFWLHGANDPMPSHGQFEAFMNSAKFNPWIKGDLVEFGSHSNFEAAYGKAWLSTRKSLFVHKLLRAH